MRLGSSFVPMEYAHLLRWWTPVREGRPWFYWTRRDPSEPVGSTEVDEEELDDAVRPLVMWCLERGWRTTPSCEGHFVGTSDDDDVEEALRRVTSDAARIREGTLEFEDTETGDRVRPHIPWWVGPDLRATHRQVVANNGVGCMGFVPDIRRDWSFLAIPGLVDVRVDGPLVKVLTRARTPEQIGPLWSEVGHRLCTYNPR
ncbi:MAG: hypothetical protein EBT79_05045 [Actinobacteria bacterium]|nr:hypothetical protein [Actinomycetota bacterium]NBR66639.1 hypothetical protein [Actinomycetota bacterium]